MKSLRELPKLRDSLSYLYVDRTRVEQKHKGVAFYRDEGEVAVPAASLSTLLLGPGSTITHAAVRQLAENGCAICWVGEEGVRFYASGIGETRSARNLALQAEAWADPDRRLRVVRKMYTIRFDEVLPDDLDIRQIRGREGVRVRDTYARWSRDTGVPWSGRSYKRARWADADPVNRALSAANACLYGVCHAAVVSLGYSPALGFIHTGKQLSFVYDVADLFKTETTIPAAFAAAAATTSNLEAHVRTGLRDRFRKERTLDRIARYVAALFDQDAEDQEDDPYASDSARPGGLWGPDGTVEGGVSHGRDDSGDGT